MRADCKRSISSLEKCDSRQGTCSSRKTWHMGFFVFFFPKSKMRLGQHWLVHLKFASLDCGLKMYFFSSFFLANSSSEHCWILPYLNCLHPISVVVKKDGNVTRRRPESVGAKGSMTENEGLVDQYAKVMYNDMKMLSEDEGLKMRISDDLK